MSIGWSCQWVRRFLSNQRGEFALANAFQKRIHLLRFTARLQFDPAISQIAHPSGDVESLCDLSHGVTKPDSLHPTLVKNLNGFHNICRLLNPQQPALVQLWRGGLFRPRNRCWLGLVFGQRWRRRQETRVHHVATRSPIAVRFTCSTYSRIRIGRRLNHLRRRRVNVLTGDVTLQSIRKLNLAVSKRRTDERHQCALREFLVRATSLLWSVAKKLRFPSANDIVLPAIGRGGWGCRFRSRTARPAQGEQDKQTTRKTAR